MKIKVDEDLSEKIASVLREAGHDVQTVLDERLGGTKDPDLWKIVQSEKRFLVTADKGFGDIRRYPPRSHEGILLLRPAKESARLFLFLIAQVMEKVSLEQLRGMVSVASPAGLRIRRKPLR